MAKLYLNHGWRIVCQRLYDAVDIENENRAVVIARRYRLVRVRWIPCNMTVARLVRSRCPDQLWVFGTCNVCGVCI